MYNWDDISKRYRLFSHRRGYIVKKRRWLLFWKTATDEHDRPLHFASMDDAEAWIRADWDLIG
jgi:hypothetical protein